MTDRMENTKIGVTDANSGIEETKQGFLSRRNKIRQEIFLNPKLLQNETVYPNNILKLSLEKIIIELTGLHPYSREYAILRPMTQLIWDELNRRGEKQEKLSNIFNKIQSTLS
jgi:hypothetical protein